MAASRKQAKCRASNLPIKPPQISAPFLHPLLCVFQTNNPAVVDPVARRPALAPRPLQAPASEPLVAFGPGPTPIAHPRSLVTGK